MDRAEFLTEIKRLEVFKKPTADLIDAYWDALGSYGAEEFRFAVTRILQNDDKFPKVPAIVAAMGQRRGVSTTDQFVHFRCLSCGQDFAVIKRDLLRGYGAVKCDNTTSKSCLSAWRTVDLLASWEKHETKNLVEV